MADTVNGDTVINISELVALFGPEKDKWPLVYDNSFFSHKFLDMNLLSVGLDTEPYSDIYIASKIISKINFVNLTGSDEENKTMAKLQELKNLAQKYEEYSGDDEFVKFGNEQFIDWDDVSLVNLNVEKNRNELHNILKNMSSLEILKVNSVENVFWILSTVIENGVLPSLIYAKFPTSESHEILTNAFIGHLRNMGYSLLCNHEGKCLLYYGEPLVYSYTDCTKQSSRNPLIESIITTTISAYKTYLENPQNKLRIQFKTFKKHANTVEEKKLSTIEERKTDNEELTNNK